MCIDKNTVFPNSLTNQADSMQAASDDDVLAASSKLMQRNKHVYEELARRTGQMKVLTKHQVAFPNASSSICAKLGESIFQCFLCQAIASHLYRSPWSTASKCSLTC